MDRPVPAGRHSTWGARLGMFALGALLFCGVLLYSTVQFGVIEGEEFSPQSFERRAFSYYEIPVVGIQVSPVHHADITGELEDYLIQQKIIEFPKDLAKRWDLVQASRGRTVSSFGEAQILCNYLAATGDKDQQIWLGWSKKNRQAAGYLWPVVARLAEQGLYVFVPDLLALAQETNELAMLKARAAKTLAARYFSMAENMQELAEHEKAVELLSEGLRYAPADVAVLKSRAQSHAALGHQQQADADLAKVRQLQQSQ